VSNPEFVSPGDDLNRLADLLDEDMGRALALYGGASYYAEAYGDRAIKEWYRAVVDPFEDKVKELPALSLEDAGKVYAELVNHPLFTCRALAARHMPAYVRFGGERGRELWAKLLRDPDENVSAIALEALCWNIGRDWPGQDIIMELVSGAFEELREHQKVQKAPVWWGRT
jgi:hypothetical protein